MSGHSAGRRRPRHNVRTGVVVEELLDRDHVRVSRVSKLCNWDQILITWHHPLTSPVARAASIAARISRTAAVRPTKTALLTIEWPMFNSSISGIAATGPTLATVRP